MNEDQVEINHAVSLNKYLVNVVRSDGGNVHTSHESVHNSVPQNMPALIIASNPQDAIEVAQRSACTRLNIERCMVDFGFCVLLDIDLDERGYFGPMIEFLKPLY